MKKLDYYIACSRCKIECEVLDEGIVCPKCGDFISNEDIDYEGEEDDG